MTPNILIRSFTNDQYILDKVFYSNYYKIRNFDKDSNSVVVDIGAHCGYFSFFASALGAKKIYSFEPFLENYKQLVKTSEQISRYNLANIKTFQFGAYTEQTMINFYVKHDAYLDLAYLSIGENTHKDEEKIIVFPLDFLLKNFVNEWNIDLLKISIGYAEFDILKSSTLNNVQNICGETEIVDDDLIADFKKIMNDKGFLYVEIFKFGEEKIVFMCSKTNLNNTFNINEK